MKTGLFLIAFVSLGLCRLSRAGDSTDDLYNLGVAYENGRGVTKNETKAFELLKKAAELGNSKAQYELGCMYVYGTGTLRDYVIAIGWFQKAADQGDSDGECMLGRMYGEGKGVPKNNEKSAFWYERAASKNNPSAQFTLALSYRYGLMGYPKDEIKSYAWLDLAAKSGFDVFVKTRDTVAADLTPEQKEAAKKLSEEYSKKFRK